MVGVVQPVANGSKQATRRAVTKGTPRPACPLAARLRPGSCVGTQSPVSGTERRASVHSKPHFISSDSSIWTMDVLDLACIIVNVGRRGFPFSSGLEVKTPVVAGNTVCSPRPSRPTIVPSDPDPEVCPASEPSHEPRPRPLPRPP